MKYLKVTHKIIIRLLIAVGLFANGIFVGYGSQFYNSKSISIERFRTERDSANYHIITYYKTVDGFDFQDSTTYTNKETNFTFVK